MARIINDRGLTVNSDILNAVQVAFEDFCRLFPQAVDMYITNGKTSTGTGSHANNKAIDIGVIGNLSSDARWQIPVFAKYLSESRPGRFHIAIAITSPHIHIDNFYPVGLQMETSGANVFYPLDVAQVSRYYSLSPDFVDIMNQGFPSNVAGFTFKWWYAAIFVIILIAVAYFVFGRK